MKFLPSVLLVAGLAWAQSPDTFEVASIKLGDPMSGGTSMYFMPGAGIRIETATLAFLVQIAYDLRDFQLSGATGWMTTERYTVNAKGTLAEGPADFRNMNQAQRQAANELVRVRLQHLLAERFQLVTHKESKDLPIYALVVAKGGSKLKASEGDEKKGTGMTIGRAMFKAQRVSMEGIVKALSDITHRPVRDETGLQGFFDLDLKWTPDAPPSAPGSAERPPEPSGPTLFTALQEQLGLKLESKKGPVETVVIDHAERPSEN